jgi:hypothetical protein
MPTTRTRSRIVRIVRTRFSAGGLPVPAEARFSKPLTRAALRRLWAVTSAR